MIDDRQLVASIAEQVGSRQEARWIVEHARGEHALELADRRSAGEPLQYVLGTWPFRTLELRVDPRVLIPRPETEQLVDLALEELEQLVHGGSTSERIAVDLGTGSGAIALSLALEGPAVCADLEVLATDASTDALGVAAENLASLEDIHPGAAHRVRLGEGSWYDALPAELLGRVDLVVSNPPYVAESEYLRLDPTVREWEPRGALVAGDGMGGVGGTAAIEEIITGARRWLARPGAMVIEIAPMHADECAATARRAGYQQVTLKRDLAGRVRFLVVRG
jgi:release factor glutamine methyltransferase